MKLHDIFFFKTVLEMLIFVYVMF